jgi:hypothetical protein
MCASAYVAPDSSRPERHGENAGFSCLSSGQLAPDTDESLIMRIRNVEARALALFNDRGKGSQRRLGADDRLGAVKVDLGSRQLQRRIPTENLLFTDQGNKLTQVFTQRLVKVPTVS